MNTKEQLTEDEQPMTFEQRKYYMRVVKWKVFKTYVGIPFLGTIVIILIISGLSFIPVNEEAPQSAGLKYVADFAMYLIAFSLLWLIVGILRFIKFIADLPVIKKDVVVIIFSVMLSLSSKGQSLRDLELLTIGYYVDSAEVKLKSWDYVIKKTSNEVIEGIKYETYAFQRGTGEINTDDMIVLYKDKTNVMRIGNFDVRLMTYSDKRFNQLKEECLKKEGVKLVEQKIIQDGFIRKYKDDNFTYNFLVQNPSKKGGVPTYNLFVKFDLTNSIN